MRIKTSEAWKIMALEFGSWNLVLGAWDLHHNYAPESFKSSFSLLRPAIRQEFLVSIHFYWSITYSTIAVRPSCGFYIT
jgi:hypothetical protein